MGKILFLAIICSHANYFVNSQNLHFPLVESGCRCSKISESAEIKCHIDPENFSNIQIAPRCTITFQQANDDFSRPHTQCIKKNTFSTFGEYPGQLRKVLIICTANYPMEVSFSGMLPHQSIGIAHYRYNTTDDMQKTPISALVVSMDVEPEITGRYSIFSSTDRDNSSKQVHLYIFAENGPSVPFLLNQGSSIGPVFTKDSLILPCRPFAFTTEIAITKDNAAFTNYDYYDATLGFVINLRNNRNILSFAGEYHCMVKTDVAEIKEKFTTVVVTSEDIEDAINNGKGDSTTEISANDFKPFRNNDLNLNVSGKWVVCISSEKARKDYRLVNMRSRNPLESSMKKLCFAGDAECLGKREGSFSRCHSSPQICKAVDFKEGGGLISCFYRNSKIVQQPHHYVLGLDGKTYLNPDPRNVQLGAMIDIQGSTNNVGRGAFYYTNVNYSFTCTIVRYLFAQPIMLDILFLNGSRISVKKNSFDASDVKEIYDISSKNIVYNNYKDVANVIFTDATVTGIVCSAFVWNSEEIVEQTLKVNVKNSKLPHFSEKFRSVDFIRGQTNELECDVDGLPAPEIEWLKDGEKLKDEVKTRLIISNTTDKNAGTYSCVAVNGLGQALKLFHVNVVDGEWQGPGYLVTVGVPLVVVLISMIVSVLLIRYYRRSRRGLSRAEIYEFLKGTNTTNRLTTISSTEENKYESVISAMPYPKEYEVIDSKFNIDETSLLGSGAYGLVYKGTIEGRNIAIKTLKRNADVNYLRSLLTELKVMIYLKDHPNIVNLVGANTKHLSKGLVYVMVELCPLGNLENYLKNNRKYFFNEFSSEDHNYLNSPLRESSGIRFSTGILTTTNILKWSIQIASAMEHLESKNVIHGDLAVRNVLLQDKETAKISDFGLSRKLYEYSNYVKQSQEPLPWRHMALESLKDLEFSSKSDVWAFGVTLWEIFSLAETPYPGLNWNVDFVRDVENGLRMSKAKFSNNEIFELQLKCWTNEPEQRPPFEEIRKSLEEQLARIKSQA